MNCTRQRVISTLALFLMLLAVVASPSSLFAKSALFVVGNTTLGTGDSAVNSRLGTLGYTVTVKQDSASATSDATGKDIVLISSTCSSTNVNTKFKAVTVPVIAWENGVFDDMAMTGTTSGTDYGVTTTPSTQLTILNSSSPLAAGLSGTVTILNNASTTPWGAPSSAADKVASVVGNSGQVTIFAYDSGATMVGYTAPARRVGFFLNDNTAADLNSNGWALFDAAVNWATSAPAADFTISASPSSQTVNQGSQTTYTVTIGAVNGFSGTVNLSASGLPTGASANFNPSTVTGSGTSTMTVTTQSSTPTGTSTLTVAGVSGSLNHNTTVSLVVQAAPSGIAYVRAAQNTNSSGGSSITTSLANTAGDALVVACREGADTTSISSVTDSAGNSYSLVKNASDTGGGARETAVYLATNVHSSASNTVSCNFASSLSTTVGIVVEEFSNVASLDASLAVTSNGTGVTSLSSGTLATTHSGDAMIFAINASTGVTWTAGSGYTIPTNGSNSRQAEQYAIVGAAGNYSTSISWNTSAEGDAIYLALAPTGSGPSPDFTISASPSSQNVTQGNQTTYTVTITAQNGFTGTVNLTASGLPSGASASFNPSSITTSGTSTMTVTTQASTPTGTDTLTITGTSGTLVHNTTVTMVVQAAAQGDFTISASPSSQSVSPGNQTTYTVTVTAQNGFNGQVNLTASGLPSGANASFSPASITGSGTSTMTVTTTGATPQGTDTLTITGNCTNPSLSHNTTVQLVVLAPSSISVNFNNTISTRIPYSLATDITGYGGTYITNDATERTNLGYIGLGSMRMGLMYATSGDPNSQIQCNGTGCNTSITGDDWITNIKAVGAEPIVITGIKPTNYHADAVNLVTHFNGNPGTPTGHPNYIKYWIIGNEPDLNGIDSTTYYQRFNELYDAMKAVDPNIKIGGPAVSIFSDSNGLGSSCNAGSGNSNSFMQTFLHNSGSRVDFVDFHKYDMGAGSTQSASTLMSNTCRYELRVNQVRNYLNTFAETQGRASQIDIEVGEWNITSDPNDATNFTYQIVNTVYGASALGHMLNAGARALQYGDKNTHLGILGDTSTAGSGFPNNSYMPMYSAYAMFAGMTNVSGFRPFGTSVVSTSTTLTNIEVFASTNQKNIVVVNKDSANSQTATFALTGYTSGSAQVFQKSDAAHPADPPTYLGTVSISGGTFSYSLPAYSVTTFVLQ